VAVGHFGQEKQFRAGAARDEKGIGGGHGKGKRQTGFLEMRATRKL
jgi:hypothetical protein